ncbi:bifunctional folylpolyglutamate synthase/dihydrofolate synthase [Virgibacillus sp. W0181]|uniref:bifunctional folylpolyglutamate synthase/dihydrofolate synthase n=1 Tax=Virgibacillus sp. W0181 TaxID=3391581 RepID=UPI003F46D3DF
MFKEFSQVERFFTSRQLFGIKPGLERMNDLLQLVGNPERKINAVHVAGTNGKGSTIQFIKHALRKNGYNVGVFTSPSFTGIRGHLFMNESEISSDELLRTMNVIYPAIQKLDNEQRHPTEFEILTVVAFIYFEKFSDIAIIESGMGGRYDTTNCIDPILSVITNVELDHTAFLGDTIEAITLHKAGIIKSNRPVVVGSIHAIAMEVVLDEATSKSAKLYRPGRQFTYKLLVPDNNGQTFRWQGEKNFNVHIQLAGEHQIHNASIALMALTILEKSGYSIMWNKALEGISETIIPGRFEVIHKKPMIIVDGAHNPAGVDAFLQTVLSRPNEKRKLVFAAYKDKDIQTMIFKFKKVFPTIIGTTFDHSRAAGISEFTGEDIIVRADWKSLMDEICEHDDGTIYYIAGSLHFISIVRQYLLQSSI